VRQLIGGKLIPLGVVAGADGTVAGANAAGEGMARSPLKINMKTKVLPRGLITPLTNVLKILFFPPILIALLIACALSQVWLFFVHGIANSFHQALYEPIVMVLVLALIVVGTAWHEFGHAAALEYGGGEVRGMGMGFYLVYPAFYTDVTDNYRLGRWARVRTDLGGFYFNLIFCLALVGLYLLTGQAFFLLGVLLIDIDIVHQCLPFVRLDGYWTLADITGIPDFFSYMGPFLRSILPFKHQEGKSLPELKRWVKAIFLLYIIVTVPLLAFLLFLMIKNVPRILASAWDSLSKQGSSLVDAWGGGHFGTVAFDALQILLLALPVAGLCFTLYSLGKRVIALLWAWSKPTPARRVAGSFVAIAIAALLVFLWVPSLPLTSAKGNKANPIAVRNNWRPISANERGIVSDALPAAASILPRSPLPAATVAPDQTAVVGTANPAGTGTPNMTGTPGATGTAGATGTPNATGTPSGSTTPSPSGTPDSAATPGATSAGGPTPAPTSPPQAPPAQAPVVRQPPPIAPNSATNPAAPSSAAPASTAPAGTASPVSTAPIATGVPATGASGAGTPASTAVPRATTVAPTSIVLTPTP
jgi:putative peptide zinc metalloprotease protein